jgi:DNA-binding transcriptional regulator GbsR (MarR family)
MSDSKNKVKLKEIKDEYIAQWGILGSNWGVNRTMAQIHALLMVSNEALSTDDIMEELEISRGNAHSNVKELVNWQLIRSVLKKGDRKEYFEAEKDSMKVFAHVARERQRREIDPVIEFLGKLLEDSKDLKGTEAKAFRSQIKELKEFTSMGANIMQKFAKMGHGRLVKWALKFLS